LAPSTETAERLQHKLSAVFVYTSPARDSYPSH
jgi:hypothetical protein